MTIAKTPEARERMRYLYVEQGLTLKAIAAEFDCTHTTVSRYLKLMGVTVRAPTEGRPGVPKRSAKRDMHAEAVAERYAKGASCTALAKAYGVSPTAILAWVRAQGGTVRPTGVVRLNP